ncbi:GH92 family glycosyl hydrolase [Acidipila sp. EB88]|uniref:GH92 family glycosyl hydrolase n=1 Tax=Acidipila sp. EB88 TaxID=2305226 RepID=UPI000F5F8999|nr:GH92 family glycosyl hydrolase [Acidipila sp. EB88]RRA47259.1 glycoside hydrolase family 92 protein [Acidipila sp. EB88]
MLTRRTFLQSASAATCLPLLQTLPALGASAPAGDAGEDLTQYVHARIGTGGHGHTYPGASVPFGAVQLSPDTFTRGWDWCAGYYDADATLMGFSHTHLSGTGCGDLLDVLLVPNTGEVKWNPGTRENPSEGYRAAFSHADEVMEPGFYSVPLKDRHVLAELTATDRVGLHRYTFQQAGDSHFVLDFQHSYDDPENPVTDATLTIVGNDTVTGGRTVHSWANGRRIYFAAQFSKPFHKAELMQDDTALAAGTMQSAGKSLKAALHYSPSAGEQVLVRVGISGVSVENALANLEAEMPGYDFDHTRATAKQRWQQELSRVRIETSSEDQRVIFYTSLYHMMLAPTRFDDANGDYMGMDSQPHKLEAGEANYSSYSLWDTFRALHPAFTLMQPERVPGMVNCLVRMAEQSPQGMPVWPLQGKETGTMTGYHSASVMAEACVKKFPNIDWQRAYKVMRKRNMDDNYRGLGFYRELGYIPADKEEESVSKVLEYDYNDWACSHVAEAVGAHDDAALQRKRSQNYQHLFDPKTQFIRAKLSSGEWTGPFDPIDMGHTPKYRDYTESNAWQTTFGVQHDVKGYIALWGGREPFVTKLDSLFTVPSTLPADAPPDIAGMVGQYAHGNEPSHHIAYLYVYAGQPWKTQARVASLLKTMYRNNPNGLEGNEDCGQMSAWYVMSALGLYAVDPASGNYVLTSPSIDKATLKVSGGKELVIETKRSSPDAVYIQSVRVNGKKQDKLWVSHAEIAHGGHIAFELGTEPNKTLATAVETAPPSLTV